MIAVIIVKSREKSILSTPMLEKALESKFAGYIRTE